MADMEDRYELGEPLGEGAMGVVHEARDRRLERSVAIKILRLDEDPRFAPAWARLARIEHLGAKYGPGDAGSARERAREAFAAADGPDLLGV